MDHYPKITVITPSYNQGRFIEQTICSILDQGYPNLEYIIIDGGSTDESVSIIRKYDERLAYWVSESDRGQSHAINKGLARATGSIETWVNSDDMLAPNALRVAAERLCDARADLVIGQRLLVDVDNSPFATHHYRILSLYWDMLAFLLYPAQESCFWRADLRREVGWVREDLHYSMDYDWFLRLAFSGRAVVTNQVLGVVRSHEEQKGNFRDMKGESLFRVRAEFLESIGQLDSWTQIRIHAYRTVASLLGRGHPFWWHPCSGNLTAAGVIEQFNSGRV